MRFSKVVLCVVLFVATFTMPAAGQEPVDAPSAVLRQEIVLHLAELVGEEYVLPEIGEQLSVRLLEQLKNGFFDSVESREDFLKTVNRLMLDIAHDKHLGIVSPERYIQFQAMFGPGDEQGHDAGNEKHDGPSPDHGGGMEHSGIPGSGITSRMMNRDGRTAVGYLRMDIFLDNSSNRAKLDDSLRLFTDADAVVIDLRECAGGDASLVQYLSSVFFAERTHLVSSVMKRGESGERPVRESWTKPNEFSRVFADIPLYILASEKTFSAGEAFVFGMQRTGRATIVGATTGGGGYMNDFYPLPGGYGVSISVGRTYDPITKLGWQETGIQPDVLTETGHAFGKLLEAIAAKAAIQAQLPDEQEAVFQVLQAYAEAWYRGKDNDMQKLIDDSFVMSVIDSDGNIKNSVDKIALLEATNIGRGKETPREYRNREIVVHEVYNNLANARLMLRDSMHFMSLARGEAGWSVVSDSYVSKNKHR